jgi:prevent-host-death family protein
VNLGCKLFVVYFVHFVYTNSMQHLSATDAKQTFSALLDMAQREPVIITKQSREVAVVLSIQDYERLHALNVQEFQMFRRRLADKAARRGLTQAVLDDILNDDAFLTALVERFQEEQAFLTEERTAINGMLDRAVTENDYSPLTQDDITDLKRLLD